MGFWQDFQDYFRSMQRLKNTTTDREDLVFATALCLLARRYATSNFDFILPSHRY